MKIMTTEAELIEELITGGGSGRNITVQAESSAEARWTVMDMFPGAVVAGVRRIK
jgi:hypothetical protein